MARCSARLKEYDASEPMAKLEVQAVTEMRKQSVESAMISRYAASVSLNTSDDTRRSETMSAVLG